MSALTAALVPLATLGVIVVIFVIAARLMFWNGDDE